MGTVPIPQHEGLLGSPASYEKTPFRITDVSSDAVRPSQNVSAAGQDLWAISDLRAALFLEKFPNNENLYETQRFTISRDAHVLRHCVHRGSQVAQSQLRGPDS